MKLSEMKLRLRLGLPPVPRTTIIKVPSIYANAAPTATLEPSDAFEDMMAAGLTATHTPAEPRTQTDGMIGGPKANAGIQQEEAPLAPQGGGVIDGGVDSHIFGKSEQC